MVSASVSASTTRRQTRNRITADDLQQIRDGRSPAIASCEFLIHVHQVPMNAPAGDHDRLRSSALPVASVRRAPSCQITECSDYK